MDPPTLPPSASSQGAGRNSSEQVPGVAVVFSAGAASDRVFSLAAGPLELGRSDTGAGKIDDGRVSRRHAMIAFRAGRFVVTDLGSQNGTFVDGTLLAPHTSTPAQRVIRIGDSLLVPLADVQPLERLGVRRIDGFVRGPAMQRLIEDAAAAAFASTTLHVRGETGSGKEGIAQAFHRGGPRAAHPLIAVNCATIPHALAERLLFGVRRGAYSGADADAIGYVQSADGGTLFLDEIAELDAQVQVKLLRVLESRELLPLGAAKPRPVDFALCSATNKDLRALVTAGALREDLYFRIATPVVTLPALRNRPEEIPALIAQELSRLSPARTAHVSLVEQCLLRPWPGNVRELLAEVRSAANAARSSDRVTARHLAATAGQVFTGDAPGSRPAAAEPCDTGATSWPRKRIPKVDRAWRKRIERALRAHAGNVTAAARALGLHRTQMRRLIARHGIAIDPDTTSDDDSVG